MSTNRFKHLVIGGLSIERPIIQGGMGVGISLAGLASAVANEGGVGVIASAGLGLTEIHAANPATAAVNALKREIRKARAATKGVLGVNIMTALTNFADMARAAVEEGIDIIFSGAGLPLDLPRHLNGSHKTKLVPIVSSGRAAKAIARRWLDRYDYLPDAFVVEGPLAGGHLGFRREQIDDPAFSLGKLIPDVLREARLLEERHNQPIPVIAAGGVYTGADIARYIRLGAAGVQMATRFVTTHECDAAPAFKQAYLDANPGDLAIIDSPVGLPGRVIENSFVAEMKNGGKRPFACPYHCIVTCNVAKSPYCIAHALLSAQRGDLVNGFAFAGQNAYRAREIVSVKELMAALATEYEGLSVRREMAGRAARPLGEAEAGR